MPITTEMGANTHRSERVAGHAVVLVGELLAVPASIAATTLVLVGGVLALHLLGIAGVAVEIAGGVLGVPALSMPFWDGLVFGAVVLATLLAFASFGSFAVMQYRRAFERFDHLRPATVVTVPLLGLVPAAAVLATTGTGESPEWLFAFTVLCAYALVYRTVAMDVRFGGDPNVGLLVGGGAAVPAALSEAFLVARYAGSGNVVRRTLSEVTAAGIPPNRWVLVLLPVGVTVAYGVRWASRREESPVSLPAGNRLPASLPLGELLPGRRPIRKPSSQPSSGERSDSGSPGDWVPRSASAIAPADGAGSNETDGTDERTAGTRTGETDDTDAGATAGGATGDANSETDDRPNADASPDRSPTAASSASSAGRASAPAASATDNEASASATEPSDHASPVERASDTRIYTGDADDDESDVAPCPECGQDVSDEATFCPECGTEL